MEVYAHHYIFTALWSVCACISPTIKEEAKATNRQPFKGTMGSDSRSHNRPSGHATNACQDARSWNQFSITPYLPVQEKSRIVIPSYPCIGKHRTTLGSSTNCQLVWDCTGAPTCPGVVHRAGQQMIPGGRDHTLGQVGEPRAILT